MHEERSAYECLVRLPSGGKVYTGEKTIDGSMQARYVYLSDMHVDFAAPQCAGDALSINDRQPQRGR